MRAVDTNVLVRLAVRNDARQTTIAEAFVARGAWASVLVLAETIWVLSSVYGRDPAELAQAVDMLLDLKTLTIQDADVVLAALDLFRSKPSVGFSDCLILELARNAGHLPLGTFDRALAKVEGTQNLS